MTRKLSGSQPLLVAAISVTAVGIVVAALVLALHHNSPSLTSTSAAGATTTPTVAPTTGSISPGTSPNTVPAPPHFDTPQAAMTYLVSAWNRNDTVEIDHVTTPSARVQLDAMHSEAVDLRLDHCNSRPQGDYLCYFDHDYPAGTATTVPGGVGHSVFLVGPARTPGWYLTVFLSCG